ncbi:MAG: CBS domain-containing protein [Eubacteriales bacterium]
MYKAKAFMVPVSEYPVVYEDDSLRDAVKTLKEYRVVTGKEHRSLLVFSKTKKVGGEGELVGIITIRDILNALKKNLMYSQSAESFSMSWASFYKHDAFGSCFVNKVGDVIRPLVDACIQSDETITKAVELMMTKNVNILPVFEGKKVVGIIRALDILGFIEEIL